MLLTSSTPSTSKTRAWVVMCRYRLAVSSPSSCPFFPHSRILGGWGSKPVASAAATVGGCPFPPSPTPVKYLLKHACVALLVSLYTPICAPSALYLLNKH